MFECKDSSCPRHISNWHQDLMKRDGSYFCLESTRALNCVSSRCGCLASGPKQAHEANVDHYVGMSTVCHVFFLACTSTLSSPRLSLVNESKSIPT